MPIADLRKLFSAGLLLAVFLTTASAQRSRANNPSPAIPANILLRIIRAEDERRWGPDLQSLLGEKDAKVRNLAALAAGRIGDERAVTALVELLQKDSDNDVRQMAAFAVGEIESPIRADALIEVLGPPARPSGRAPEFEAEVRGRAIEALGKIAAALPDSEKDRKRVYGEAILNALKFEAGQRSMPDRLIILLGLTAALRAKPDSAGPVIKQFLNYSDPRIVADALNTLARLRLKDGNEEARQLLVKHEDPIVRANAARVLGATEDKQSFDALLDRALRDNDLRVRVSAIRALGGLKDKRATVQLSRRGVQLFKTAHLNNGSGRARNEGLEILTALGLIPAGTAQKTSGEEAAAIIELSLAVRAMSNENIPEDEIAHARETPGEYVQYLKGFESAAELPSNSGLQKTFYSWSSITARAAGLGELGRIKPQQPIEVATAAQLQLRRMLDDRRTPPQAIPNILTAYAVFKLKDLGGLARTYLGNDDVIVRATAAELLGEVPPDEANARVLIDALRVELPRIEKGEMNDAALAILDALAKQKSAAANDALKTALDSSDHLIRRKAVALLKANGIGDFSTRIGTVRTRNSDLDYRRAIARIGKHVTATVVTTKGSFVIEFLAEDAPLTVDNFIMLARKGFFNGQTIPRVVPNFVIQAGDPRGDTNGGPGYQIRCEINEVPYERGAVGMALSGKDTGGSQWFVTHSPQPHLDGGYTVFGRVISGMEVVDNIARGDIIRRVIVNERQV